MSFYFKEDKLKYKLKGLYPQLVFDKPARRNLSPVVHSTNIRLVGTGAELHLGAIQSSSGTSIEYNLFTQGLASSQLLHPARDMLYSGIALCNSLSNNKPSLPWPRRSGDLTDTVIESFVPTQLFNHVALTVAAIHELPSKGYAEAETSLRQKIMSICQDIVYLHGRGSVQTQNCARFDGKTLDWLIISPKTAECVWSYGEL